MAFVLVFLTACGPTSSPDEENNDDNESTVEEIVLKPCPNFEEDSAYAFLKKQLSFGPRVPNSQAHVQCGDYLINKMNALGWDTLAQVFDATAFDGTVLKSRNIIASLNADAPNRILLAAHWDCRPFNDKEVEDSTFYEPIDGANDGASGVAVLMEVARAIAQDENQPGYGIDIIFFDSEDYGYPENYTGQRQIQSYCLGSQHWGKNKHKEGYAAYYGILLDMVGAKDALFYREGYSMKYAPKINQKVWQTANKLGYINFFKFQNSPAVTDDHYYVNTLAKIPMIDIIDFDPKSDRFFPDYHHTKKDNIDLIDKKTLKAVGQTMIQLLYNEVEELQ